MNTFTAWLCVECNAEVTGYSPGVCHEDGTLWLICGPCFNRYQAAFLPPETDRWEERLGDEGQCGFCGRDTIVRPEPFSGAQQDACKPCWDQVIG